MKVALPVAAIGAGELRWHGPGQAIDARTPEAECLHAIERERVRLGQELHDDLCQVLAGVTCLTGALRRGLRPGATFAAELAELHASLTAAMERTRALSHGLAGPAGADGSLRATLDALAWQLKQRFDFLLAVRMPARMPAHEDEALTQIFRILQDATQRSAQDRGRSGEVAVRLSAGRVEIALRAGDADRGGPVPADALDWRTMHRRAEQIGGTLEAGRGGLILRLTYPLPAAFRRAQQAA
jgi:signal transduction histidine kinase